MWTCLYRKVCVDTICRLDLQGAVLRRRSPPVVAVEKPQTLKYIGSVLTGEDFVTSICRQLAMLNRGSGLMLRRFGSDFVLALVPWFWCLLCTAGASIVDDAATRSQRYSLLPVCDPSLVTGSLLVFSNCGTRVCQLSRYEEPVHANPTEPSGERNPHLSSLRGCGKQTPKGWSQHL